MDLKPNKTQAVLDDTKEQSEKATDPSMKISVLLPQRQRNIGTRLNTWQRRKKH
jgi:hypothetical protein